MQITEEWAGWYKDLTFNHDKIWAGAVTDTGIYLAVWGRRGTRYQHQEKQLGLGAASRLLEEKMREKSREGYRPVAFNDPRTGDIPSFATGASTDYGTLEVTPVSIVSRLASVKRRLEAGARDLAKLVLEYQQVGQLADVLIAFTGTAPSERNALVNALAATEQALQQVLIAPRRAQAAS